MLCGELGEDFTINLDACFFECPHEFAIGDAVQTGGGVDLDFPELAGGALFLVIVLEAVDASMQESFTGGALF